MPNTDPHMPAVRACWCGAQVAGEMPCCLEHALTEDLRRDWLRLSGLLSAARQEREQAIVDRDLAWLFRADVLEEVAALKTEIAVLRARLSDVEPPPTQEAPVLEG